MTLFHIKFIIININLDLLHIIYDNLTERAFEKQVCMMPLVPKHKDVVGSRNIFPLFCEGPVKKSGKGGLGLCSGLKRIR